MKILLALFVGLALAGGGCASKTDEAPAAEGAEVTIFHDAPAIVIEAPRPRSPKRHALCADPAEAKKAHCRKS
jgi:hypothetical protein